MYDWLFLYLIFAFMLPKNALSQLPQQKQGVTLSKQIPGTSTSIKRVNETVALPKKLPASKRRLISKISTQQVSKNLIGTTIPAAQSKLALPRQTKPSKINTASYKQTVLDHVDLCFKLCL